MRRRGVVSARALLSIAALFLPACHDHGHHTGPSEGVTVYEHHDFGGDGRTFDGNAFDLRDVRGPCQGFFGGTTEGDWDDCISSIRLSPGWEVTLYEDDEYHGESLTITGDVRDLDDVRGPCGGGWEDCISSLQVHSP